MKRLCLGVVAIGLTLPPAQALDGTRSPANVPPVIGIPPGNNPNVDFARQLQRGAADLLAQANPGATAPSIKEQLVGAWALVSCKSELPGASFCANPNGIFIIDASGHYAMVYAARGRPKTSAGRASPAEELKVVVTGAAANFGTWSFNEADKTITFHYDGALFPNPEGMDFKSTVSLSGDELKLDQDVLRRIKK
jgi:Lipocalin-like domain